MVRLHWLGLAALIGACASDDGNGVDPTLGPIPTGSTPELVEIGRYVGLWYEIASIPMGFQAACYNTTARYGVIDDVTVSVFNECNWDRSDGAPLSIEGTATVTDLATNAKLLVDFGFNKAPYWIVDVGESDAGEPYPWAAVSNDTRDSLWILARTSRIPEARFDAIYDRLDQRGFDPARMMLTPHAP